MKKININIKNKRATFDYELVETFTAGIMLTGTEIKSIRLEGKGLWVRNMHITPYFYGSFNNPDSRRDRKLLLNKNELNKIRRLTKETGYTIIPVRMFINDKGLAKLVIAVARGKKQYDKRQSIREKEDKRDMDRMFKQ